MARIFITGSSDGLGRIAAEILISQGHRVVLHARNIARARETRISSLGAEQILLGDLSSISETRLLAKQANGTGKFDAVIFNAAVGDHEQKKATADGLSHVFAINSLAPYILTCLIEKPARMIYMSSGLNRSGTAEFSDPNWDFKTLNWDTHIDQTLKASTSMDALDSNLKPYFDRGGKIISYHGWADPQISPGSTSNYYDSVIKTMGGASKVQENFRLFMVPGMNHCGGGLGTDQFDMLTALETWVEKKQAPASIPASRVANGQTVRTRPLCPYPQTATYKGSGSTDDAANFTCK